VVFLLAQLWPSSECALYQKADLIANNYFCRLRAATIVATKGPGFAKGMNIAASQSLAGNL
jgi:hypothetical protein